VAFTLILNGIDEFVVSKDHKKQRKSNAVCQNKIITTQRTGSIKWTHNHAGQSSRNNIHGRIDLIHVNVYDHKFMND